MKKQLILALVFLTFLVRSQSTETDMSYKEVNTELEQYMAKIEGESPYMDSFRVYAIYFYLINNRMSFTMGNILNASNYKDINPSYFFLHNGKYVIVRANNDIDISKMKNMIPITRKNKIRILQTLYPCGAGYISGYSSGLMVENLRQGKLSVFYENDDDIPKEYSIYTSSIEFEPKLIKAAEYEE